MRKFRFLVLMGAAVIFLFSGCGKTDCSTVIPDVKSYFSNATITQLSHDVDELYYVLVTDYADDAYDKYEAACKNGNFSNVTQEYHEKKSDTLIAVSKDGNYGLAIHLDKERKQIHIKSYKSTENADS